MVLVIDVGNTNIKYGVYEKGELVASFRVATTQTYTSDELGVVLINLLKQRNIKIENIEGIIISSVVPSLNYTMIHTCKDYLKKDALLVGPGIKTGLNIRVDNPREVGADRIVNCISAYKKYGESDSVKIVIDFGTATTFNVVTENCEFTGGAISPGIKSSLESLVNSTAKLPRIELSSPGTAIGKNTITNMQAGVIYGFAGLVDFIVRKMKEELKGKKTKVIATGGFSEVISKEIESIDIVDKKLTLDGLYYVYELNKENGGEI